MFSVLDLLSRSFNFNLTKSRQPRTFVSWINTIKISANQYLPNSIHHWATVQSFVQQIILKFFSADTRIGPEWKYFRNGSAWPLEELEKSKRATNMKETLSFGNHKGAVRNPIFLRKLIEKDVVHGYGLVLPLRKIDRIPGVLLAPMNIMTQNYNWWTRKNSRKGQAYPRSKLQMGLWNISEQQGGQGRPSPL